MTKSMIRRLGVAAVGIALFLGAPLAQGQTWHYVKTASDNWGGVQWWMTLDTNGAWTSHFWVQDNGDFYPTTVVTGTNGAALNFAWWGTWSGQSCYGTGWMSQCDSYINYNGGGYFISQGNPPAGNQPIPGVGWPIVSNVAPSGIATTLATLNGNLAFVGQPPTTVSLCWGTTDGGTNASQWQHTEGFGARAAGPVSTNVTGLSSNTVYCYRVHAVNANGHAWTDPAGQFKTLGVPSVDNAGSATNIMPRSARLTGQLTSGGGAAVTVYWGTTDGGTTTSAWQHADRLGVLNEGAFAFDVRGLDSSTIYHYRCFAASVAGTDWADSTATFQTSVSLMDGSAGKMKIVFSGYNGGGPLTNFPALVVLGTNVANFSYGQFVSTNGYDLRFADADEGVNLNYEIEKWDVSGRSYVWVQMPLLRANTDTIWAYWGNPEATSPPAYTTNGATWDATFAGVWHLKERTGVNPTLYDSTSNHMNSTSQTWTPTATGIVDGAGSFNGSSQYIGMGSGHAQSGAFTVEGWANPTSHRSNQEIFSRTKNGATWDQNWMLLESVPDNVWCFQVRGNNSDNGLKSSVPVALNTWAYVAGVYYAGNSMLVYVNGAQTASGGNGTAASPSADQTVNIGAYDQALNLFQGSIDEVRVSNVARSSNWLWACHMTVASNTVFSSYQFLAAWVPPGAPSGLTAIAAGNSQINLAWTDNATNENSFLIERSAGADGAYVQVATVGADVATYNDTGLSPSTIYYYRVRAGNWAGNSGYANEAHATTLAQTFQSAPAIFVETNSASSGNWLGRYGTNGYNIINNAQKYPSYATVNVTNNSAWSWAASTADGRGLQYPNGSGRIAACWYTGGAQGAQFSMDVSITDGQTHQLAIYCYDWDPLGRKQHFDVYDYTGGIQGALLSRSSVASFGSGVYLAWNIRGRVLVNVVNDDTAGNKNATISGLFFDPPMVVNNAASNVTATTATLCGTLNSTGATARTVYCFWGPADGAETPSLWSNGLNLGVSPATVPAAFSNNIAGLTPNTTYYYCFAASNSMGLTWAPSSMNFLTGPGGPVTTAHGMPYAWLTDHGITNTSDLVETQDADSDGMNNLQEYQADTDPTNSSSCLQISGLHITPSGVEIGWKGGTGVWQYLERRQSFLTTGEQWRVIFSNSPPTLSATNVIDAGATNRSLYYRIKAVR